MSFEHLKYVNNIQCRTFNDACKALGLAIDDLEWKLCLQEASSRANAAVLRNLFVIILINYNPTELLSLFNMTIDGKEFHYYLSEDFLYQRCQALNNPNLAMDETNLYECLLALESNIRELTHGTKKRLGVF
jgi:hypothetical protein